MERYCVWKGTVYGKEFSGSINVYLGGMQFIMVVCVFTIASCAMITS